MHTGLSRFCGHVIESGWLTATVVVPLFFNVYSSRVFEPDKLTLLRSIALTMIAAWLIKTLEEAQGGTSRRDRSLAQVWARLRSVPLVLPTLLLIAVYLISTLGSVAYRASLWGSYQRLQGTYTTLSYVVLFLLLLQNLRQASQIRRLVTMIIVVSLPVSMYGLLQHYGLDPLPWGGDVSRRVAANMGNAIFVAAYLIMVVPLTLSRVVETFSAIATEDKTDWRQVTLATSYLFILVLQLICIVFTRSRGPWVGLMCGLFFFVLLVALVRQWREVMYGWIGLAVVAGLFLALLNMPGTPLEPLKELPYVGRLGRVFEKEQGTGKVRDLIWQGAVRLISPHPPIEYPGGRKDALNLIRPFIGYGPESMYVAYNRFYPPELAHYEARNASPDRSHNETFDALVITGLVGFAVYMLVFASAFYHGLRWLGAIATPRQRHLFVGFWIGGGAVGAIFFSLWQGIHFLGVGLPFGVALGLVAYLIVRALLLREDEGPKTRAGPHQLLLIGLISALMAHFVEIHFGIAIAATRTNFWVYAGLMVAIGHYSRSSEPLVAKTLSAEPSASRSRRRRRMTRAAGASAPQRRGWDGGLLCTTLLMALVLISMAFDYVTVQFDPSANHYSMVWLFALTWAVGGAVVVAEWGKGKSAKWVVAVAVYVVITLPLFMLYLGTHLYQLRFGQSAQTLGDVLRLAGRLTRVLPHYYTYVFALLLAMGGVLRRRVRRPEPGWQSGNWWLYPPLMLGLVVTVYATNLQVVIADIIYKQAQPYDKNGQWAVSIPLYRHAVRLAPQEDFYYLFLGRAFLERAKDTSLDQPGVDKDVTLSTVMAMDPQEIVQMGRYQLLIAGREVLQRAQAINPLNTDHSANLGRLCRTWAEMVVDPSQREDKLAEAREYYRQATSLSPNNVQLWNEWGLVHILQGEPGAALAKFEHSLDLDKEYEQTYLLLGDLYMNQEEWQKAADSYGRVLDLKPGAVQAHSALGFIYAQQGRLEEAVEQNLTVAQLSPKDFNSRKNLAMLYSQLGDRNRALSEARRAWEMAPESQKGVLAELVVQLGGQVGSPEDSVSDLRMRLNQGQAHMNEERWEAAASEYRSALELASDSVEAHSALGFIYAKQGRLEDAVRENLTTVQLAPQDYNSHKNLALLYRQLGQLDRALEEALVALELAADDQRPALQEFIDQLQSQEPGR